MTRRSVAWLLAILVALAGCQPAPSAAPSTAPSGAAPSGVAASGGASAAPSVGAPLDLGAGLRDGLDIDRILADLQRLEADARAADGTRSAGGAGEQAAIDYVSGELRSLGWDVELGPVSVPYFQQASPSRLAIVGGRAFDDIEDFKAMLLSGSGDATGPIHSLGFDPDAQPGDRSGSGCSPEDWNTVPAGSVVLVQPGSCFRRDVIANAQEAGVVAIVTSYPEWQRGQVRRPTLVSPNVTIPILGTTHEVGVALAKAAEDGGAARVSVDAPIEMRTSNNVIAESPWGDPEHVVMLGGHLDGTIDGPGINDNGSGTMTVLEIARRLDAVVDAAGGPPAGAWKVRVAFFTGEEIGFLGSGAYTRALPSTHASAIQAYLNFDMLGSGNGVRAIYDGAGTARPSASVVIAGLFEAAFDSAGLTSETIELGGASDHAPFDSIGIPTGGLFSGASERKSVAQAELFGGQAGMPNDPCYHLGCDTFENLDPVLLEQMARAAAWVVGTLATGETQLGGS